MVYLLVFLFPFSAAMIYIAIRNKKIKHKYTSIAKRIEGDYKKLLNKDFPVEKELKKIIIDDTAIIELEKAIHDLEDHFFSSKSKSISKIYSSRIKKLNLLSAKVDKLKNK